MASSGLGSAALRASQIRTGVSVLLSTRTCVLQGLTAVIVSCAYFDKELVPMAAAAWIAGLGAAELGEGAQQSK